MPLLGTWDGTGRGEGNKKRPAPTRGQDVTHT